jgi:hypothetical protein
MSFPVFVHQNNGHFFATLVGVPELQVTAPARETALAQMQAVLAQRFAQGELVFLNVEPDGFLALAGAFKDDDSLTEICEEAYRRRDDEPKK